MGILDRLMFWKSDSDTSEADEFGVNGCFTLPDDPTVDTDQTSIVSDADGDADADCAPAVDSIAEHLHDAEEPIDGETDAAEATRP